MPKQASPTEIQLHLQTLSETPRRIAAAAQGMDERQLKRAPAPEAWSAVQILAHLRGCAEVWGYSIYAMLMLERPELPDIHPRTWTKRQGYDDLSFGENFQALEIGRTNLLRILHGLRFDEWSRSATFGGKLNTHTVFTQTRRMALHELEHWEQFEVLWSRG